MTHIKKEKVKVLAILQARVSSSRLPNKVLLPILDTPMLVHQIKRISYSKMIDKLVVATSNVKSDDVIMDLCNELGVMCYRGELDDVLDRFYQTANLLDAEHVVRLTGDCPLTDPDVIDAVIFKHLNENADYTSNCFPPTFPDGLDVEVLKYSVLEQSWINAKLPSQREHVTLYIREKDNNFHIVNYEGNTDLSSMRWTVDERQDFCFVTKIYKNLYEDNNIFKTSEILSLLKNNPDFSMENRAFKRNEGLLKSTHQDYIFLKGQT